MTALSALPADIGPYVALVIAAALPNAVWRWIAVLATARLNDNSPVFAWVRHVATSLVAGVVAQLLLSPSGALAATPLWLRFGALVIACGVWLLARRNVLAGWIAGVVSLAAGVAYL